ncbi:diacylglycerol/lipid kinase family protein [Sphingomonas sp. Leaf343]|uniref:diacylglycerol/lipid kinase family protein n=1 Tax=Sphingomonas sp. Leaf343 TaxID=1736345 RepID=UPI0006F2C82D|nr:acylglycerol kinase family protein [Sphingomonas sp. Leaf343]KQR87567.1 hypothetical protein ASG07_01255 [Sphingomonas sp. Leaf343]
MSATVLAFVGVDPHFTPQVKAAPSASAAGNLRVGIVCNPKSHRNRGAAYAAGVPGAGRVMVAAPSTREALAETLAEFAAAGIDLLVIDGGDGTVRDVLSGAGDAWGRRWPAIVVIPSGKTNALAIDLGLPADWTLDDALIAARVGRTVTRRPLEIARLDAPATPRVRGFLMGAGGFVSATELAQRTHRVGAFNGVAVGLALGWTVVQTMFGSDSGEWRSGTPMTLTTPVGAIEAHPRYLLLASTMERMPLGLKPFGPVRQGLKLLDVDAPPRMMAAAVPAVLAGRASAWLAKLGYHRRDMTGFRLEMDANFILDGEHFSGGALEVRQGPRLSFVVP